MGVVGGDDHQRACVLPGERERHLHRLVEVDHFADLATRVGGVRLLVDRRALDLEEKAFRMGREQFDRLGGHCGEPGLARRALGVVGTRHRGPIDIAVIARPRAIPAHREVAFGEQPEQRRLLVRGVHRGQAGGIRDHAEPAGPGLFEQRLALPFAGHRLLGERFRAAAQRKVRAHVQQLLGDRAGAAVLQGVFRTGLRGLDRTVAFPVDDVRDLDRRGRVLDLGGGDVAGGDAGGLGELDQARMRAAVDIDPDRAVGGLGPDRPGGAGGG